MDLAHTKYIDSWWAAQCDDGAELLVCAFQNLHGRWSAWVRLCEPSYAEPEVQSYLIDPPSQDDISSCLGVLDAAVRDGTLTLHHGVPTRVVRHKIKSGDPRKAIGSLKLLRKMGFAAPICEPCDECEHVDECGD